MPPARYALLASPAHATRNVPCSPPVPMLPPLRSSCLPCPCCPCRSTIKDEALEGELPAFDLGKKVGRKIFLQKDRRAVVVVVVDAWDFDGSLPRQALM